MLRNFTVCGLLAVFFMSLGVSGIAQEASGLVPNEHMLKKPAANICELCHAEKARFYNSGGHGKVKIACQACHNAHGQGSNKMLRWEEKGFCLKCHGKMAEHFSTTGHGKIGLECQGCHDPHGVGGEGTPQAAPEAKVEGEGSGQPSEKKPGKKEKK